MAKKKASKVKESKAEAEVKVEQTPPPAIVPEQIVKVRGTSVGGTRSMTKTEFDEYQKSQGK